MLLRLRPAQSERSAGRHRGAGSISQALQTLGLACIIDSISINISTDGTHIFMDMEDYARTAVEYMEQHMQIPRTARDPIKSYIAESPPLAAKQAKAF